MSKKKLILLILAATLTVALVVGGIILGVNLAKGSGDDEGPAEQPTETIDGDKSQWKACKHVYDDENDPDCNLCGERRVPEEHEEHGEHVYDENVGGGHICIICGHDKTLEKCVHAYDNACDPDCNLCGETREPADHVSEDVQGKEPTCTESGLTSGKICSVCGKVLEQQTIIEPLGHSFGSDYEYDNDSHWYACTRCDAVKDKAAHTLDDNGDCVCGFNKKQLTCEHPDGRSEWRVTTAATCLSDGVETLFCLDCNKKLSTRSIPKGDHVPSEAVRENIVDATCTTAGSYDSVIYCSACHTEISRKAEAIEALGHEWSDTYKYDTENHWRVCERDGCEEIGDKAAHTIGADGKCTCGYDLGCVHTNTEWRVVSPATCIKEGSEEQVCKDCNTILGTRTVDKLEHTPTNAVIEDMIIASCENPASYYEVRYCRDCGAEISRNYIVGETSLGHNYGKAYKFDATGHWNVCTRCGKANDKIAHDTGDGTICICGYNSDCKHESCSWVVTKESTCISYGEKEYVCDACGIVLDKQYNEEFADHTPDEAHKENVKSATCTTNGSYDSVVSCKYCSCVISREHVIVPSQGHKLSETYINNTENHWKYCEVCKEVVQTAAHSIGSDYYCTVCGYYSKCTHPSDKLSGWLTLFAATCEHSGYEYRMCGDCHALIEEKYTEKLSHTYITMEENRVEASCEADGSYDRVTYCKDCGYELSRTTEVIAGGHKEYVVPGKAPTCTEWGYTSSIICPICEEIIEWQEDLPATGHTEVSIPAIAATCTTVGYSAGMKCSECGEVTIAPTEIKALGHKWSKVYSSNEEEHWRVCTRDGCGVEDTKEAHNYSDSKCTVCGHGCEDHTERGEWTVVTESTCTEKGVEVRYCLSCGAVAEEREIDLAPHVPDIDAATCTQDKVCVNCNTKLEDALGHNESGDWESDGSVHWKTCARCSEKIKEETHIPSITTATCIKDRVCTTCNRILEAKKGHSYKGDCGTKCVNCGLERESTGAHTEVTIPAVEATCTKDGKTEGKQCAVCGEITQAQTKILPLGHSYELKRNETSHWKECTRANCDKKAEDGGAYKSKASDHKYKYGCSKTCQVCGYERDVAHAYENNCKDTCTICGKVTRIAPHTYRADCVDTCSTCGNERTNVATHYYEYACSDTCVKCGYKRTDASDHTYDSACDASCNVCGEIRAVGGHNYSETWTPGETAHYKVCTVDGCTAKSMVAAHTYSTACTDTCSVCGSKTREAEHVYSNDCDTTCDICGGKTREASDHKYSDKYAYNEWGYHYKMCSICGVQDTTTYEVHTSVKNGICETCGYNSNKTCKHEKAKACEVTCPDCGISLSNRVDHKYEAVITDAGHYYKCKECGLETSLQEHVTASYRIVGDGATRGTGAGESVNASSHKVACIVCNKVVKEEIRHDFVHDGVCECGYVAECEHEGGTATCKELAICVKCGCGYGNYAAHTPEVSQSRIEATCTATGLTAEMKCSYCKKVLEEATEIPAKGHNMVPVQGQAATCTSTGLTDGKKCSVCGEVEVEQTEIPMKEHSWRQSSYTAPKCESNGTIVYTCIYCGEHKTETILSTGHAYGETWYITKQATCDVAGEKVQICKNCGEHGAPETIDALGHTWGEEITIAPTCESGGYTYKICSVCKKEDQSNQTLATGHTSEESEKHEAGCLTDGYVVYVCEVCGKTLSTEIISAKGAHVWDETTYIYGDNGHWRKCSVDGCEGTSDVISHTYADGKCTCGYECKHRGGMATCTALATCEICGTAYGEKASHSWKDATCTTPKTCSACSATEGEPNGHTAVTDAAVAPTCTKNGLEEGSHCKVCQTIIKKQETISATGHTYGEDGKCTVCEYDSSEDQGCEHKYNSCTDRICANCGHLRPEEDAQHVLTYVAGKSETCTEAGAKPAQKCAECGKLFSLDGDEIAEQETIAASGHDYIWIVQSVATCAQEGSKYQSCTRCGNTGDTETTAKTEHSYVTITVESTCSEYGYTTTTCKVCGVSTTSKSDTLKAHTAGQWIVETAATCTDKGSEYAICAVCSQPTTETRDIEPLGHNNIKKEYAATCTSDGYATYTCTRCTVTRTETAEGTAKGHTAGNWIIETAPTCDTNGTRSRSCAVCGTTMTETRAIIAAEGHNYVSSTVAATCTQEGKVTYSCSKCGYENEELTETLAKIPHNYGAFKVGQAASCLDDGWNYRGCSACTEQEIYTVKALGHNNVVTIVDGYRVTTCSRCTIETADRVPVETTGHTCNGDGGYRVDKEASCGATGIKYAICSICGKDYGDAITIDALEHDWVITVVAPTCTAQGVTTKTCNNCGDKEETYPDKLEHVDGGYAVDYDATCTEPGQKHKICKRCGETIEGTYEEIPAKGHKYTLTKVVIADCVNGGYTEYTCSACNGTVKKDETEALGHADGGWIIDSAASCTESGSMHQVCARCGETIKTETIEPTEHSYIDIIVPAKCTEQGYTLHTCKYCGYDVTDTYVDPLGHTTSGWIIDADATCTAPGTKYTVCTVCGSRDQSGEIPAKGHDYKAVNTVAPTCTEEGYTIYVCSGCLTSYNDDTVDPTGHTYDENVGDGKTCTACGAVKKDNVTCEHDYKSVCSSKCYLCGAIREGYEDGDKHVLKKLEAVESTCTETGLTEGEHCTVCGTVTKRQEVTAMKSHSYAYACSDTCSVCGTKRTTSGHKYTYACDTVCSICGQTTREAEHKFDNNCDTTCNYCGKTRAELGLTVYEHVYTAGEYKTNLSGHWQVCTECGAKSTVKAHEYKDEITVDGHTGTCYDTDCDVCGYTREVTHTLNDQNICTECGYEVTCDHKYDDCLDTTCNLCGATRVAPGHKGGTATCTAYAICEVCGKTYGDKAAHTPNIPEATCDSNKVCTVCHRTLATATGHNYTNVVTEPTCTERGYTTSTCSKCGKVVVGTYVSAKGHTLVDIAGKAATCTTDGKTDGKQCSVCGTWTVLQTTIAAKGHSYKDGVCTVCSKEKPVCSHVYDDDCDTTCNVEGCGEVRVAPHYYGENYVTSSDMSSMHWKECSKCKAKTAISGHTYGSYESTEGGATHWRTCSACGYKNEANHQFSEAYTSDGSGHWHVCAICKAKSTVGEHSYEHDCSTNCSTCNYKRNVEHTWSSTYKTDGTYHWYECQNEKCDAVSSKAAHSFGDYKNDATNHWRECSTCHYKSTEEHNVSTSWTSDGGTTHYQLCSVCGAHVNAEGHSYKYTCSTKCSVCGNEDTSRTHKFANDCATVCEYGCGYTRAAKHSYSTMWTQGDTQHWYECSVCEAKRLAADHVFASDCITACSVCGKTRTTLSSGEPAGHVWSTEWSYTAAGHYHVCSRCNSKDAVISHDYGDNACGTTCKDCSYTRTVTHTWESGWSYDETYHYKKCTKSGCSARYQETTHSYTNDCDTDCNICGATRTTEHDFSGGYVSDATNHWKACTKCGEKAYSGQHGFNQYECEAACNVCGRARNVAHSFDNACDTTCNYGCGYTREASHSYSTVYSKDASSHWQECVVCNNEEVRRNVGVHTYNGNGTTCDTCGYNKTISHNWSEDYKSDGTYHWKYCTDSGCTEVSDKAVHVGFTSCTTKTCTTCGYVRGESEITHTRSTTWKEETVTENGVSVTYHYKACMICGDKNGSRGEHAYDNGCDTDCNVCGLLRAAQHTYDNACDSECNECKATRTAPHAYGTEYVKTDADQHWLECSLCGMKKNIANHIYDNNCDEYCNVCYHQRTVKHTESSVWSMDAEEHWKVCSVCGTTVVAKAEHDFTNACDNKCDTCGLTRTVGDHEYETDWVKTDDNYHWHKCKYCGVAKDKALHNFGNACGTTCKVCGKTRTAAAHVYATTLTHDSNTHWYACINCGEKSGEIVHQYDNDCDTSCNTDGCGYTRKTEHQWNKTMSYDTNKHWTQCSVCGNTKDDGGHAWTTQCDTTCDTCGYTRSTDHSWSSSYTYESATGKHWRQCLTCGEKMTSSISDHDWANSCDTKCDTCGCTRTITHTYDNDCDTTCNICGNVRSITHSYPSARTYNDTYHWYQCTVCGNRKGETTHTYASTTATQCSGCAKTRTIGECEHVYDNPCLDKTCNKCGKARDDSDLSPHVYANDCTSECTNCKTTTRVAPHNYQYTCSTACQSCSATRTASHNYSGAKYLSDANGHWQACTYGCGTTNTVAEHKYNGTCGSTCTVCSYERQSTHTWSSTWSTDASYHWYACTGCGQKKDYAEHYYTNACATTCNGCGYTRSITHPWQDGYTYDGDYHWQVCTTTGCSATRNKGAHGYSTVSVNDTQHKKYCKVCGYVQSTDSHTFSDGVCTSCGAKEIINESYATSVDFINLNGPFAGYGSNTDNQTSFKGFGTDLNFKLSINGWCVTNTGILGYYYSIDDGETWTAITTGTLTAAGPEHVASAMGNGVSEDAPTANCVFQSLSIDLSAYKGQTLNVIFAAQAKSKAYVRIITLEDVKVWNYGTTGQSTVDADVNSGSANSYSLDNLKVNGRVWKVHDTNAMGTAAAPYTQNHTSVSVNAGDYVTLSGWLGYKNLTISSFGYYFAESPSSKVTDSTFVGSAEAGVLASGGANAKRFTIDVDTASLSVGVHRVYFIVQLSNGTYPLIHYVDIYVTGTGSDWTAGDGDDPSEVDKDTTVDFSTAPSSVSGGTYTFNNGFVYTDADGNSTTSNLVFTSSGSYTGAGTYRFNITSSGTTLTFNESMFTGTFNRFKLRYSSSVNAKVSMTYKMSGNLYTDTFYLEPVQGTFTSVIKGYLDGDMIDSITSITVTPQGATSGTFMLAGLVTEQYKVYGSDLTYIENSRFKVGVRLSWGGALCYFEDKNDGMSDVSNLINAYDVGRLVQQSWYMNGANTGNYNGTSWKYNPVQGGDWNNNESRLIDVVVGKGSLYVKCQPMDWGAGTDGKTYTISRSYMENWYTVYTDRLYVKNRFYDFSGIGCTSAINQEIPAMYFIGYLNTFAYNSSGDINNTANTTTHANLPFWSGGSGSNNEYDQDYGTKTRFAVNGTQAWGAWYNPTSNFAVGFYTPGIARFISGRNQHNIYGDTKSPFSPGCSYTAAGLDCKLSSYKAYTYSYMITSGYGVDTIRSTFAKYASSVPSHNLSS